MRPQHFIGYVVGENKICLINPNERNLNTETFDLPLSQDDRNTLAYYGNPFRNEVPYGMEPKNTPLPILPVKSLISGVAVFDKNANMHVSRVKNHGIKSPDELPAFLRNTDEVNFRQRSYLSVQDYGVAKEIARHKGKNSIVLATYSESVSGKPDTAIIIDYKGTVVPYYIDEILEGKLEQPDGSNVIAIGHKEPGFYIMDHPTVFVDEQEAHLPNRYLRDPDDIDPDCEYQPIVEGKLIPLTLESAKEHGYDAEELKQSISSIIGIMAAAEMETVPEYLEERDIPVPKDFITTSSNIFKR